MERHQRIQLKKTSRSTNQPFQVSPFQTRGFGLQQKAASTPASKAELWENYQRSSQIVQQGAGQTRSAIQAKLSIGQPGDKYEQEADSVADRVMAMSEPAQVQREELGEEEEELQMKPLAGMISPLVQREELPEEEEELQMKPEDRAIQREALPEEEEELQMKSLDNSIQREALPEEEEELQMKPEDNAVQREALPEEEEEELQAKSLDNSIQREALPEEEEEIQTKQSSGSNVPVSTPSLEHRLSSSKGGGNPLSDDVRSFMEPRFGADFSGVRVHTGSDAVQMNQDVNAQAFAHGSDVYFGAGKAPGKDALTAHELTHVVQQTGGNVQKKTKSLNRPIIQSKCSECEGEKEINRKIDDIQIDGISSQVQRQPRPAASTTCDERPTFIDSTPVPIHVLGDNVGDFLARIVQVMGDNPHMQSDYNDEPTVGNNGRIAAVNMKLSCTIIRPVWGGGRVRDQASLDLIKKAVELIKSHEEEHRSIAKQGLESAVCSAIGKSPTEARRILKTATKKTCLAQEEYDLKNGGIEGVRGSNGDFVDVVMKGLPRRPNYDCNK
jgi:Domain of unknown function (DUF4157)